MKKILFSGLILFGLYANAQVNVTSTAGTSTATYTTLKGAFDAINAGTHQGSVNLSITANTTETATAVLNAVTTYTSITIKPTGVFKIGGAVASNPLVKILGSNVTIDGSSVPGGTTRDLTINNASPTSSSVLYMGSPTSTSPLANVIIKNTNLTNGGSSSTNLIIASGTSTAGYFNNVNVLNNSISAGFNGIFVSAVAGAANGNNLMIADNTINTITQNGIYIAGVDGISTISNNTITVSRSSVGTSTSPAGSSGINISTGTNNATVNANTIISKNTSTSTTGINYALGISASPGTANVLTKIYDNTITEVSGMLSYVNSSGIYLGGDSPNIRVYANKISGLKNNKTGNPMQGILLGSSSSTSNILVYNNIIFDVQATGDGLAAGIYGFSGAGYKIYNNTVNLNTSNAETGISAPMYVVGGATNINLANALDIRNNLFINNKTTGSRYSIYSSAPSTVFGNINYNDYYSTGTNLGFIESDRATLADVQTGFGGNVNSLTISPAFVSATDMKLNASASQNSGLDNKGVSLPEVTVDFAGMTRSATPDMGSYEFTSTALAVQEGVKTEENILVYPNPFADVIKISNVKGIKSILVSDASGRSLKKLSPSNELDLRDLKTGLYMISFQLENGSIKTVKVLKK